MVFYRVYVIENPQKRRYIGISENVKRQLADHNEGLSRWTKGRGPWNIQWKSIELSLTEARKLENKMKKQKGGRGLSVLVSKYSS
ncbi:MAG: GIY-YIG nuclease family protein [Verrucomicrobiota bacterium]